MSMNQPGDLPQFAGDQADQQMPQDQGLSSSAQDQLQAQMPGPLDPSFAQQPNIGDASAQEPVTIVTGQILQAIQTVLGRGIELDTKVAADAVSTYATAYKTLIDAGNQPNIHPQDQLALEQSKLEHTHTIDALNMQHQQQLAKDQSEVQRAQAMHDMQLKAETANQQAEQHQQTMQHKADLHQQALADAATNQSIKVQESQARQKAMASKPTPSSKASS